MQSIRIIFAAISLNFPIRSAAQVQCWKGNFVAGNDRGEGTYAVADCALPNQYCVSLRSINQRYNDVGMSFELRGCSDEAIPIIEQIVQCKGIGCQWVDFQYQGKAFRGEGCCCTGNLCNDLPSSAPFWRPQHFSLVLFSLLAQLFFYNPQ